MTYYYDRPWMSEWFITCYLFAAKQIEVPLEGGPDADRIFVADIIARLANFGRNLAVGGALCAAYEIGQDPPIHWRTIAEGPYMSARIPNAWHPGCDRPVSAPEKGWTA